MLPRYSERQDTTLCLYETIDPIQGHGHNKYTRTIGDVILAYGTNVLSKDGWCWWYRKYALLDTQLETVEKEARAAKKGLWAAPQPVPS